jgi:hypothetical protein
MTSGRVDYATFFTAGSKPEPGTVALDLFRMVGYNPGGVKG